MILLPLIYIALIFGMGKLVWWHLENDLAIFDHAKGRAAFLALVVYLGPAVAGGIFVLFLIKPLFSRAAAGGEPFRISEKTEPHLFALVGKVCDLVGAPHPKEIRLDNNVNAAAAFRKGWLSFFSNDLMLIIGMPLIAGMTTRQVVGVLAHEFGHFAQGGGMRLQLHHPQHQQLVRQSGPTNGTPGDERLENWARTDEWWLKIIMQLAKGGVWLGRKILWCLMQVGHGMSCFMSRQMEYDADSYEAKIAGSEEFAKTAERLRVLSAAHHAAMGDAFETFQQQELPEDLAALTMWRESTMPADVRNKINEAAVHAKTGWGDTHPADADRIASVTKLRAAGVFHKEGPATELFVDYPSLSKAVTRHYFATEVGVNLEKVQFQNMDLVLRDRQSADEAGRHLDEFFGKRFYASRLQPLPASASVTEGAAAAERMQSLGAKYEKDLERYDELQQRLGAQTLGRDLTSVDFTLPKPDDFYLPSSLTSQAEAAIRLTVSAASLLETDLLPFDQAASTRLAAMLTLSGTQSELSDVERAHRNRLVDSLPLTHQRLPADGAGSQGIEITELVV